MSRLSPDELAKITGRSRPTAQLRWFREHFGATLPCDALGPIITDAAFEGLVAKGCGLRVGAEQTRPAVKMLRT